MVDYSKWDKMAGEMSDDDDGETNEPTVTSFDKPTSVTWGGNPPPTEETSKALQKREQSIESLSVNGREVRNSDGKLLYVWKQTRDEVTAMVRCPEDARAKEITVTIEKDASSIDSEPFGRKIQITHRKNDLLKGELKYPVLLDKDDLSAIDWTLESNELIRRGVVITLIKKCPVKGATLWWDSFMKDGQKIDLSKIEGRNVRELEKNKLVWEQAMEQFTKNVRERKEKRTLIDVDSD